jgi:hypothetical protein
LIYGAGRPVVLVLDSQFVSMDEKRLQAALAEAAKDHGPGVYEWKRVPEKAVAFIARTHP